jgi:hypothetical protein
MRHKVRSLFNVLLTITKGGSHTQMLNKVMLIGYAGADSEMKFTAAGIPVANFSLVLAWFN